MSERRLTTKDRTPGERVPMLRGYRCEVCGAVFTDRRHPGDRGSFPGQNRARGNLIKHYNATHVNPNTTTRPRCTPRSASRR